MSLPIPNLDDRTYKDLLDGALEQIRSNLHTSWNDFTPGDPGMVLLEAFSYLTEQMIYRLNRLPEKVYIEFLRMMGVGFKPPYAAHVQLCFWQQPVGSRPVRVPRGTRVATQGVDPVVFTTVEDLFVPPESRDEVTAVKTLAYHAGWAEETLAVPSSGRPGQEFSVARPPILANAPGLQLCLGIEASPGEWQVDDWLTGDGRRFHIWEEVANFARVEKDQPAYRVERQAGKIYFAPAAYRYPSAAEDGRDGGEKEAVASQTQPPAGIRTRGRRLLMRWPAGAGGQPLRQPADCGPRRYTVPTQKAQGLLALSNQGQSQVGKKLHRKGAGSARSARQRAQRPKGVFAGIQPKERSSGMQALAAIPPKGCRIRVRYPVGGGSAGNIPSHLLTTILEPTGLAAQLKVTNTEAARGGMDAETLANAKVRGPREVFAQERLITARDFENKVLDWPEIARAYALAFQDLWEHAVPGMVSISMVPALSGPEFASARQFTKEAMERQQARLTGDSMLAEIEQKLESQSPLGVHARLEWARYKRVTVSTQVTLSRGEDPALVQKRLEEMLYRSISPLPPSGQSAPGLSSDPSAPAKPAGWIFGSELHLAEVSRWILNSEPGAKLLTRLELKIDSAPDRDVHALAADHFQPSTWYAASGSRLFRTTNNAAGWEELLDFSARETNWVKRFDGGVVKISDEQVLKIVCPSPYRAGVVVLAAQNKAAGQPRSPLYLSTDCGESWYWLADIDAEVTSLDWLQRAGQLILLLATTKGLKEIHLNIDAHDQPSLEIILPIPVVSNADNFLPIHTVKVIRGKGGNARVAVAMHGQAGVYLSKGIDLVPTDKNASNFFRLELENNGLIPPIFRCLGVQWCEQRHRFLLWAGAMAPGEGCCRWTFDEQLQDPGKGCWITEGWIGGSCLGLAFLGSRVLAATARGAILAADVRLPVNDGDQFQTVWRYFSEQKNSLPLIQAQITGLSQTVKEQGQVTHIPFTAVATNEQSNQPQAALVLAGCGQGVFRSLDQGVTYEKVSRDTFTQWSDSITIPPNWLLVSGLHQVRVVEEGSLEPARKAPEDLSREEAGHEAG